MPEPHPPKAFRALVVEDDYFIADDLKQLLLCQGADLVALSGSTDDAMTRTRTDAFEFALIDINIQGTMTFSVADEFLRQRVPFAFVSGYDRASIPSRFDGIPNWGKPYDPRQIIDNIRALQLSRPAGAPSIDKN